jgi:hypothetical protein
MASGTTRDPRLMQRIVNDVPPSREWRRTHEEAGLT